jgi:hypothetical protein
LKSLIQFNRKNTVQSIQCRQSKDLGPLVVSMESCQSRIFVCEAVVTIKGEKVKSREGCADELITTGCLLTKLSADMLRDINAKWSRRFQDPCHTRPNKVYMHYITESSSLFSHGIRCLSSPLFSSATSSSAFFFSASSSTPPLHSCWLVPIPI